MAKRHVDEGQAQRIYDSEDIYRTQGPPATGIAPRAAYGAPPAQRLSRQDGVIYLE